MPLRVEGCIMSRETHEREALPVLAVKVTEAARILGISRASIYELLNEGALHSRKFGRDLLIEMSELRRWLDALPVRESRKANRQTGAALEATP
jgi:excisionase family DNA binding protein